MPFLSWLANSWFGRLVLGMILDRIGAWAVARIQKREEARKTHEERVAKAQAEAKKTEALKEDSTAKEVDDAIDDQLGSM